MSTDPTTELDAMAVELGERERLRRRAELVAQGRRDSARGHRALIRDLTIVLALSPYTRATDAPPGRLGMPIEQTPPHLQQVIPRQRTEPTIGSVAMEMERRREADRQRHRTKPPGSATS